MEFRIADTFTDSLARLTGDEQKAVKTTAFDKQVNPSGPGLSFHKLTYPPLRTVYFSDAALSAGVETRRVNGTPMRVTSVAKTVADCFKFRNKVGLDVPLEALREARRTKKASADELGRYAKIDRVANVMRPYLEAVA